MLTQAQVQRYAVESGLRDIMIAEKEVVLTFLLQLLSERGILNRLGFKGGTCLRKMFLGHQGRFSTDLDFTGVEDHDHEDVILEMMAGFNQPFHGIQFAIADEACSSEGDRGCGSKRIRPVRSAGRDISDARNLRSPFCSLERPVVCPCRRRQSDHRALCG